MKRINPQRTRSTKRISCLAILVMMIGIPAAYGDQAVWGPVTGRTGAVAVTRHQYGDVNVSVSLNCKIPDSHRTWDYSIDGDGTGSETITLSVANPADPALIASITGSCDASYDPTCLGLERISGCNWGTLPVAAQQALTTVLGPCSKQCITALSTGPGGELLVFNTWQCMQANTAECVRMVGTMTPRIRIDLIERGPGCQF